MKLAKATKLAEEFFVRFSRGGIYNVAGSIRRKEPDVGDIDLIVREPLDGIAYSCTKSGKATIVNCGKKKMDVDYKGMRFNIYYTYTWNLGAMLFFLTGPKGYVIAYRKRAKESGMLLNQYGLYKGSKLIAGKTEEEIYEALGKTYKQPELRGK
jgi:DNA polymerase (family 10)